MMYRWLLIILLLLPNFSYAAIGSKGNNGTLVGAPTRQSGGSCKTGGCILFASGKYVTVANQANFSFEYNQSFSISTWINTSSATEQMIVAKNYNSVNWRGYGIEVNISGKLEADIINDAAAGYYLAKSSTASVTGGWHHVAMTYNGNNLASGLVLYIDGAVAGTTTDKDTLGARTITNPIALEIGSRDTGTKPFIGTIDDPAIFTTVLTLSNVQSLCGWTGSACTAPTSLTGSESGIMSGFNFDETSGTLTSDVTGLKNLSDTLGITETVSKGSAWGGSDSISLTELLHADISRIFSDTLSLTEGIVKSTSFGLNDTLSLTESVGKSLPVLCIGCRSGGISRKRVLIESTY